jgi:hypothetical protein
MSRMRMKDIKDTRKAMENRLMLETMQIDSKKWPTILDMNTKIDENVVLP